MRFGMFFQQSSLLKFGATKLARVVFRLVHLSMNCERSTSRIKFVADFAFEAPKIKSSLLLCGVVSAHVVFQVSMRFKTLVTVWKLTNVRFLASVNADVCLYVSFLIKLFVAAWVRTFIGSYTFLEN